MSIVDADFKTELADFKKAFETELEAKYPILWKSLDRESEYCYSWKVEGQSSVVGCLMLEMSEYHFRRSPFCTEATGLVQTCIRATNGMHRVVKDIKYYPRISKVLKVSRINPVLIAAKLDECRLKIENEFMSRALVAAMQAEELVGFDIPSFMTFKRLDDGRYLAEMHGYRTLNEVKALLLGFKKNA